MPPLLPPDIPVLAEAPFRVELALSGPPPEHLFPWLEPRVHESLLLSGGAHPLSEHSYVGLNPFLVLSSRGGTVTLADPGGTTIHEFSGDPFRTLSLLTRHYRRTAGPGCPPFWSGAIGYLGYELGRRLERLPSSTLDDLGLPELYFVFYRHVLGYSHRDSTYTLCGVELAGDGQGPRVEVEERIRRGLRADGQEALSPPVFRPNNLPVQLQSNFSRSGYLAAIRRAQEYIREGDIYQVNLSQRFQTSFNGDPYGLFLKLFRINPAPFFAYLNPGPFQVIGTA